MVYYLWRERERERKLMEEVEGGAEYGITCHWLDIENLDGGKFYNKFCCHCFCRVFFWYAISLSKN